MFVSVCLSGGIFECRAKLREMATSNRKIRRRQATTRSARQENGINYAEYIYDSAMINSMSEENSGPKINTM